MLHVVTRSANIAKLVFHVMLYELHPQIALEFSSHTYGKQAHAEFLWLTVFYGSPKKQGSTAL